MPLQPVTNLYSSSLLPNYTSPPGQYKILEKLFKTERPWVVQCTANLVHATTTGSCHRAIYDM